MAVQRPRRKGTTFTPKTDLTLDAASESVRAKAELAKKGLHVPPRPDYDVPRLPEGVTDLDEPKLMELFVQLNHWANHLGAELAMAEIDERAAEHALAMAEASALVLAWGQRQSKEDTVTLAKAQRESDPGVIKARDELQVIYAKRKLLQAIQSSAEKDAALVSRELTRRVGRADRDFREARWRP